MESCNTAPGWLGKLQVLHKHVEKGPRGRGHCWTAPYCCCMYSLTWTWRPATTVVADDVACCLCLPACLQSAQQPPPPHAVHAGAPFDYQSGFALAMSGSHVLGPHAAQHGRGSADGGDSGSNGEDWQMVDGAEGEAEERTAAPLRL